MSSSARAVFLGRPPGIFLLMKWMTCSFTGAAPNVAGGNYPTATGTRTTSPTGIGTTSPQGTGITSSTPGDPNSVPEVQGIPCTGANTGQCIGLEENQVPVVTPHSSISSSP